MAAATAALLDQPLEVELCLRASLAYRPLAMALVSTLIGAVDDGDRAFHNDLLTAFGEAFNNVVIHGYRGRSDGLLRVEARLARDQMTLRLIDDGLTIDFDHIDPPDLDTMPEGGMGIFMIHALMDEVGYAAGDANVLTLVKRTRKSVTNGSRSSTQDLSR